jgi:hypothetical protein
MVTHLGGDDGSRVKINRLVDARHHTALHQVFNDLDRAGLGFLRQVTDGDHGGDFDYLGLRFTHSAPLSTKYLFNAVHSLGRAVRVWTLILPAERSASL